MVAPEQKLGEFIRELRLKKGLNLQELAAKVDYNYVHLSYIEKGLRIPSDELLAKLAKELAENKEHEKEIKEKMFLLLAQIKAPEEIRNRIALKTEEEVITEISMPKEFIDMLKKDIEEIKNPKLFDNFGIPFKLIQKVIDGRAQLSRTDVIKVAQLLHKDVDEYLMKAGYIPEEFYDFIGHKSIFALMRSFKNLPPESVDNILTAIEAILRTVQKKEKEK